MRRRSISAAGFDTVNILVMLLVAVVTLYPFLNVLAIAFNESADSIRGGVTVFPRKPTFANFQTVFAFNNIPRAFMNSVLRTVIGTVLSLGACSMVAFTLSRRDFKARKALSKFFAVTLYVSGGLVPVFLLIRDLGLMNNFLVYIVPGMVNAFNAFMIRSYMDDLPLELQESAKMDGANDFLIYARIIMPLCAPVLATVALFIAVGQWNSWFDTYLYNGSEPALSTLQYELMKILQSTQSGNDAVHTTDLINKMRTVTPESIKMAITIITITPIMIVYPFLQKYFVRGMTLGAVKG
jgi:putative aldouronate transport system permease protein